VDDVTFDVVLNQSSQTLEVTVEAPEPDTKKSVLIVSSTDAECMI
jgi:hypothetical protein